VKKVLIVIAVVVLGFVGFIMTRSGTFHVERSTKIDAPPDVVFAQLADFHNWAAWSAWDKKDATMKKTYDGTAGTVGSSYSWVGNDQTGEGKMTVSAVQPNQKLSLALEFIKPFAAKNAVEFRLTPAGDATQIVWALDGGGEGFMAKAMNTFMSMDKMVGPDFEQGLASLKTVAEADAKKRREAAAAPPAEPAPTEAAPPAQPN
jgi:uncharacterized protein YndB with AHSA1/START domain